MVQYFIDYTSFKVSIKYWLYSLCCTMKLKTILKPLKTMEEAKLAECSYCVTAIIPKAVSLSAFSLDL